MTARDILLAWAQSGGFAALHNGGATDEAIVDDLLRWLAERHWRLFHRSDFDRLPDDIMERLEAEVLLKED